MRRWFASLGGRILLVTVGVAFVAVLVTAVVSLQLVQTLVTTQAQADLGARTTALSQRPLATLRILLEDDTLLGARGERFVLVGADGTVPETGPGALTVTQDVKSRITRVLDAGRSVSTSLQIRGESYVVEARPLAGGGGLVGFVRVADITDSGRLVAGRILLAVLVGLVVAVLAGLFLSRRLARPLERTAGAARRLADGERGVLLAAQGIPEIDDVSRSLRALDHALGTSETRQREFLLSVSHEIRTPLTAIRGYAEALAEGVIPASGSAAVGDVLVAETKRVDRFVSDLLELARLEADDFTVHLQPIDVGGVLAQAALAWQGQCTQLGVALRVDEPGDGAGAGAVPGVLTIVTDGMRLRQIVDGLLENALRATPAGGEVVLAARRVDGRHVRVEVRDSGPGLSTSDAAVAFERGVLRAKYRDIRPVNTGLGLSIAARLVTRMGGTITVQSAAEGGACFAVVLPVGDGPVAH
ncbi:MULTISPECIES: HAMP domain-containing sensor histidine kinase [Cryobacterium]|uniref:histidine kinase n=1 Tax=Cryobacterium glucosi TaxID=1259175 RepID=A0ABY2IJS7_9MICO|nr:MULTISPECIES: HAMP domain-containing sensor histidine kinase [Cryobacterium]TFC01359.1 HAMP domain-containing histidine kinase [Cryobacterium sp. MDB2-A-1]TFC08819.1 HAMP domain-containing histidine kinase [Cryobacterium sp. MDB2-33-2]TFC09178.1 HAMP domain-containing histidine kinase [Cryobacterium sp. MDB2-A-2]TFC18015.1 HAMP domain-containing histidine kinase [Cryobacterium glucosi]TFC22871.1 HAMP domain-containing histidine kinase [Cryobacterium sp. MDB1-18-2]